MLNISVKENYLFKEIFRIYNTYGAIYAMAECKYHFHLSSFEIIVHIDR